MSCFRDLTAPELRATSGGLKLGLGLGASAHASGNDDGVNADASANGNLFLNLFRLTMMLLFSASLGLRV